MSRGPGDRRRSQRLRELNLRNEVVSQVIDLDSESDGDGEIEAVAVVINEGAVRRPLVIDVEREGTRRRSGSGSGGDDEGWGGTVIRGRIAVVRPFLRQVEGQREEVSGGGGPRQVAEVLRGTNGRLEETSDEEEVVEVDKEEDEEELLSVGWSSVQEVSPDREDPSLSPDIEEVSPSCPVASSESEEEVVEVGVVGIEEAQLAVEALQIGREETEELEGIVVSDQEERVDEEVTLEQDHVDVEAEEDGQDKEEDDMIIGLMGPAAPQQLGGELEKTQQCEVVEVEEPQQQIDVEVLEEVAEAEVSQNQEENEVTINATEPVASSTSSSADSQQQIPDDVPVEEENEATEWPVSDTSFCSSTVSTSASTIVPSDPEDGQEEEGEAPLVINPEGQDLQEETVTREEEPCTSILSSSSSSPSPPPPAAVSTSSSVSSASDEEPLLVESPPQVATTSANKPSGNPEPDPVPGPSSQPPRTQFIMPSYWQYLQKSPEERKEVCRQYAIAFFAFEAQRKLKAAQKEEEARKAKLAKEEEKRRRKAEADERARQLAAQPRPKRTVKRRVPFGAAPEDQIDGKLASKEKELPGTSREALENLRKRKRSVSCGSSGPDAKKMKRSNSSQSSLPRSNPRSTSSSSPTPSTSTQPQQSCPLENDTGWVGADKWLVEKLLDARYRPQVLNRVVEYRIKWKGWADEHNSWEPSAHVDASSKRIYWKRELKDINKLNRKLTRVPPPATDFPPTYFMTDLPKVIDTRKDPTQLTATGVM